jgi:hypothetical protein
VHPKLRVRNVLATAVAAVAAVTVATAGAGASARAVPATVSQRVAAADPAVLLINGDRLVVRPGPDGRSAVSDLPAGGRDSLVSVRLGGRTEVIPADALPYLGRGLDPGLFDLNVLQRAESGGRLPVLVTFRGHRPGLPGVTLTGSGRGTAEGYLTVASARAFGAALERQFRSDHGRDSYGSDGLFAGGVDIAVAGAPAAAPPVRPDYPMHTLTVTATDLSGKPDNGDGAWVLNAGNLAAFSDPIEIFSSFYHGVAKFSVPAGHYWVMGEFDSFTSAGGVTRLDVPPEVTVGRDITVHVAERGASSQITMVTPRPAVPEGVRFAAILGDLHGSTGGVEWYNNPGSLWVSPMTRKPAVGTLHSSAFQQLISPPGAAGIPYAYNLDFAGPAGIIPAQHYQVQPSSLATVTDRYYQDVPSTGDWLAFGAFPKEALIGFILGPLALPGTQTQYFSTAPDLLWSSSYDASFSPATGLPSGGQGEDTFHVLSPSPQVVDWNRYPLHPQPDVSAGGAGGRLIPLIPSAIRSGNTLTLTTRPFSDNQPGHLDQGSITGTAVTGSYQIDQNGIRIFHGSAVDGIPPVTLSRQPSVIRFTLDAARAGPSYLLSTSSHTVWTWRSRPQPAATVPPSWYCAYVLAGRQYKALRRCAVQPMMTLDYQVQGLALNGTAPPGPQLIGVHAGHIQLAAAARVTRATAQLSCNDGRTWHRAAVSSSGGGKFRIAFSAPGGCQVTMRVSAADAAGGSIAETITRAYKIAS